MITNGGHFRLGGRAQLLRVPAPSFLVRFLTAVASAAVLVVAVMFSLVFIAAVTTVAVAGGSYLWWKTRALRRRLREGAPGGRVIEGEVIRRAE